MSQQAEDPTIFQRIVIPDRPFKYIIFERDTELLDAQRAFGQIHAELALLSAESHRLLIERDVVLAAESVTTVQPSTRVLGQEALERFKNFLVAACVSGRIVHVELTEAVLVSRKRPVLHRSFSEILGEVMRRRDEELAEETRRRRFLRSDIDAWARFWAIFFKL